MKITVINPIVPSEGYARIMNKALRDKTLSWKATGMLAFILSHDTDKFTITRNTLNAAKTDGETATRAAIKELEAAGYLIRRKLRTKDGRFTEQCYDLVGCKDFADYPQGEKPCVGFPQAGKPQAGFEAHKNTNNKNTNIEGEGTPPEKKAFGAKYNNAAKMEERFKRRIHFEPNRPEWQQYLMDNCQCTEADIKGFLEYWIEYHLKPNEYWKGRSPDLIDAKRALNRVWNEEDGHSTVKDKYSLYLAKKMGSGRRSAPPPPPQKVITEEERQRSLEMGRQMREKWKKQTPA